LSRAPKGATAPPAGAPGAPSVIGRPPLPPRHAGIAPAPGRRHVRRGAVARYVGRRGIIRPPPTSDRGRSGQPPSASG
jgi:hypothetical protein